MLCRLVFALAALLALVPSDDARGQQFSIDHFKIYDVADIPTPASVQLRGQFDEDFVPAQVRALSYFATPVDKNGEGLINPNAHLSWYSIVERTRTEPRSVIVRNQFGEDLLTVGRPLFLLAPAEKREAGSTRPSRLSHFKVYAVSETEPINAVVSLKDQFGSSEKVRVLNPILFAVPVEKIHGDTREDIANEDDHLTIYRVAPADREVTDQFKTDRPIEFHPCRWLAVPSKKQICEIPHFKAYPLEAQPIQDKVALKGQFDEDFVGTKLTRLSLFANPVSKNGEGIPDRNAHLNWYEIEGPTEPERTLEIRNQFGVEHIRIGQPKFLASPAEKHEEGSEFPKRLDHFKCYEVLEGRAPDRVVSLEDQFGRDNEMRVLKPRFFCVPVEKLHGSGKPTRIHCPSQHLTVYDVAPRPRVVVDQFGVRQIEFAPCELLCVPTLKRVTVIPPKLDHFEIYDVEPVSPNLGPDNRVDLTGAGGVSHGHVFVGDQTRFAVATDKNGEGLANRHAHLTVFDLDPDGSTPERTVEFENQFGPQSARLGRKSLLLVPAQKFETGSQFPAGLDHYVAFEVLDAADTEFGPVTLVDQLPSIGVENDLEDPRPVRKLRFFAVPVRKKHGESTSPEIQNPTKHLAIYDVDQRKTNQQRGCQDQFGRRGFVILQSSMLAVPSDSSTFAEN